MMDFPGRCRWRRGVFPAMFALFWHIIAILIFTVLPGVINGFLTKGFHDPIRHLFQWLFWLSGEFVFVSSVIFSRSFSNFPRSMEPLCSFEIQTFLEVYIFPSEIRG